MGKKKIGSSVSHQDLPIARTIPFGHLGGFEEIEMTYNDRRPSLHRGQASVSSVSDHSTTHSSYSSLQVYIVLTLERVFSRTNQHNTAIYSKFRDACYVYYNEYTLSQLKSRLSVESESVYWDEVNSYGQGKSLSVS